MSGLGAEVRKRTDALDSLGNTTAATGKGFAIGSAALTGLALLASYIEEIRIGLTRLGNVDLTFADGSSISVANATFIDFMDYYEVHLMNPKVLSGMFLGSMMAFLFCGLTMNAVGRAAGLKCHSLIYNSKDNMVVLPKGKLAVIDGLEGFLIAESDNVLLICRKDEEHAIRKYVNDAQMQLGDDFI